MPKLKTKSHLNQCNPTTARTKQKKQLSNSQQSSSDTKSTLPSSGSGFFSCSWIPSTTTSSSKPPVQSPRKSKNVKHPSTLITVSDSSTAHVDDVPDPRAEEAVKKLQQQVQTLTCELYEIKNQNQLLKKSIYLVKNAVKRETGSNSDGLEHLMKKTDEGDWTGREEIIVALKKKYRELKEQLEEKGIKNVPVVRKPRCILSEDVSEDRRVHWRLKLESQDVLRHAEVEKQEVSEKRNALERNLKSLEQRISEVEENISSIRSNIAEAQKVSTKGETATKMVNKEKEMKCLMHDKSQLKIMLKDSENKAKVLSENTKRLEKELQEEQQSCENIERKLETVKAKGEELNIEMEEVHQDTSLYFSDSAVGLFEWNQTLESNVERLDVIGQAISSFLPFSSVSELKSKLNASLISKDDGISLQMDSLNEHLLALSSSQVETVPSETDEKTSDGMSQESVLNTAQKFARLEKLNFQKTSEISDDLTRLKEFTQELLRIRSRQTKLTAAVNVLQVKRKMLSGRPPNKETEARRNSMAHNELFNQGRMTLMSLKNHGKFVKKFIMMVISSKPYDFHGCLSCWCKSKELFVLNINKRA